MADQTTSDKSPEAILRELDGIRMGGDRSATPLMCFAMFEHLYFRGGGEAELRARLLEAAAGFLAQNGEAVTHYFSEKTGNEAPIAGKDPVALFQARLAAGGFDGDDMSFGAFSKEVAPVDLLIHAKRSQKLPSAYSQARPIAAMLEDPDAFVADVVARAAQLRPEQGTVSVNPHRLFGGIAGYPKLYWPLVARFPGLGFPHLIRSAAVERKIIQANWLTILDDGYVEALGGDAALAELEAKGITLHRYEGGVVLQAGPIPELGDINAGVWPRGLAHVYAYIAPAQARDAPTKPNQAIKVPEPLDPLEETRKWLTRFDRMPEVH
ncbi:MAG: type VI immunity family protein [Pseudomonadota bacterium]